MRPLQYLTPCLAALSALLTSCLCAPRVATSNPKMYGYSVDAAFTDNDIRDVRDGVEAWEEACAGKLVLVEAVPQKATLHFHKAAWGALGFMPNGNGIVGLWHVENGVLDIVPGLRTRAIVIHELGHAWGLSHNDDTSVDSFMRSDVNNIKHPYGAVLPTDAAVCRVFR
jgi:hypothetical protein